MTDTATTSPATSLGGSELILGNLKRALPELTEQVQIILSKPESVPLEDKPRILWLQDLAIDPASAPLKDAAYRARFNRIVFCSNWQQQQYNTFLGIPFREGLVIKNAVPLIEGVSKPDPKTDKFRFIYTSTPHRGLEILSVVAEHLATIRRDWQLDVYSSLHIYGWHEQDKHFDKLYDQLRQNPCVNYHGSVPNAVVREAVKSAHCFVYPSIYAETSCMAAQEAMMAGCLAITTNYGALPETVGDWGWMFQYSEDFNDMAQQTLANMKRAIETWSTPGVQMTLKLQRAYYQMFYSFEGRIPIWKVLLEHVIAQGVPKASV
jgi:UDP-glucose:(glucosyl)LPS alpha-1,2-glucosyltransferase